jgi:FKBP-type peptidyl-prolyl cis-trans isomerase
MKRFLLFVAAVALSGCNLDTGPQVTDNPSDPSTETFAPSLGVNIAQMTKTADGVYYKELTVGTGAALSMPVNVTITYTGFLKDASVFDTGTGVTFNLSGAIVGFQEGMMGMHVGGERLIVIPSELAYGPNTINGTLGTIPPNSTLVFDVKLLDLP